MAEVKIICAKLIKDSLDNNTSTLDSMTRILEEEVNNGFEIVGQSESVNQMTWTLVRHDLSINLQKPYSPSDRPCVSGLRH